MAAIKVMMAAVKVMMAAIKVMMAAIKVMMAANSSDNQCNGGSTQGIRINQSGRCELEAM